MENNFLKKGYELYESQFLLIGFRQVYALCNYCFYAGREVGGNGGRGLKKVVYNSSLFNFLIWLRMLSLELL